MAFFLLLTPENFLSSTSRECVCVCVFFHHIILFGIIYMLNMDVRCFFSLSLHSSQCIENENENGTSEQKIRELNRTNNKLKTHDFRFRIHRLHYVSIYVFFVNAHSRFHQRYQIHRVNITHVPCSVALLTAQRAM